MDNVIHFRDFAIKQAVKYRSLENVPSIYKVDPKKIDRLADLAQKSFICSLQEDDKQYAQRNDDYMFLMLTDLSNKANAAAKTPNRGHIRKSAGKALTNTIYS